MPKEGVGMCTIVICLLQAAVLLSYIPNVLCAVLQVAAKVLAYYAQCCRKLCSSVIIHSVIVLLVLMLRALHKEPGL